MNISIGSSFVVGRGNPAWQLKAAAEAGFSHVHWGHQWNSDFIYSSHEIRQIGKWLDEYGLKLWDIHGSSGQEKRWFSTSEYERKAGVELVANRAQMLSELGGGVLVMHGVFLWDTMTADERAERALALDAERRSLDELMPVLEKYQVKLAQENLMYDTLEYLDILLDEYPAELFGLAYDSGHGNLVETGGRGLDWLEERKERLLALHLHDNDTVDDWHNPPFCGNVDWKRLICIVKSSPLYSKDYPWSFEVSMRKSPFWEEGKDYFEQSPEAVGNFLKFTYERCLQAVKLSEL